jgi:hypothetical protein
MYTIKSRYGATELSHIDMRLAKADAAFIRAESIKDLLAYALAGIACAAPIVAGLIVWAVLS